MSTTKLATRESFRVEMRPLANDSSKRQNHVVAVCRKCDRDDALPVTTRSPHIPAELASKMFRKRGWAIGANRNKDTCPSCHGRAKADSAPPEEREDIILDTAIQVVANAIKPATPIDPTQPDADLNNFILKDEQVGEMLRKMNDIDPDVAELIIDGAIGKHLNPDDYRAEAGVRGAIEREAVRYFRARGVDASIVQLTMGVNRVLTRIEDDPRIVTSPKEIKHYRSRAFLEPIFEAAREIVRNEPPQEPKVDRRTLQDAAQLRAYHDALSPEERSELSRKGHATRKLKQEAKIAEQRERRGAGPRRYWAAMTEEQRSERQKAAAKTRLAKKNNPTTIETHVQAHIPEVILPQSATKTQAPATTAEPPRQATPAENRRIIEALDTHYDTNRQCYLGDMTDEKLSKEVGLPRAWIGELRERIYGPERNAAQDEAAKAVTAQWAALDKLESDMMASLDAFDKRIKNQRADLIKVGEIVGVRLA